MRNRKLVRWLLSVVLLIGALGAGAAAPAVARPSQEDILAKIKAIPGMTVISESPTDPGYRFFLLSYKQPIDHRKPWKGTFEQRLTLLHKSQSRPMVLHTSGYNVRTAPFRSEPTQLIDGNQISVEQRFFTPSRPAEPADWSKLDIWQAATDHHRLVKALKKIYPGPWISTGASKGGMTSVYHHRFYPHDVDGTVAYVAPNDVVNDEDSAYDKFFRTVGTKECRDALDAIQREALVRRDEIVKKYQAWAESEGRTFTVVGSADKAYENVVMDLVWTFRQYSGESACGDVPATTASTDAIYSFVDDVSGFDAYTDQGLSPYTPYYYQAGTQLGAPAIHPPLLKDLQRYPGTYVPRSYVPREIPMRFERHAMADVDRWVRGHGSRLLFVYGDSDPWGAEPFRLGHGTRDSARYFAPGANHGANISKLVPADRTAATADLRRWAGVGGSGAKLKTERIPALDSYNEGLERRPL
ncbi:S28 family serine protease [Wenjunlia tyrosinilytica]|uniref:Tripeptidyl aminopeptidase n=1 Tax=Wenjunlia tyrosinilytica TaxID=1544741 RepID=A0A917ZR04_9ACTN|nr:S28 family serine protease [Wenjunlia tyrosinilytica]GGO89155.1 tripeptidyl aminopeptidase [Wenjunlia tyrosinilytica]